MQDESKQVSIGENVTIEEEGDEIVIRFKKAHRGGRSGSGKTVRVASTLGNKQFAGVVIGLNVYVKE